MIGKHFSKAAFWFTTVALALSLVAVGPVAAMNHMPGKGTTVQPARATWTSGFFLEAIYSRALEDLGYTVKDPKKLSNPIFFKSVYQGDVDFWANGWFPIHYAQLGMPYKEYKKKASICGTVVKGGALQGYLVSKRDVEKFGIESIDDFKRPEVKKAFDANGDGKADLVACPPGWGCEKVITHHLDVYDLEDHINPIKASYSASMADAVARYNSGEPVLFYTWTPNWTVNKLKPGKDVMWINVPKTIPSEAQAGYEDAMVHSGVPGAVTDPIKMGFPGNDINVVANNEFLAANPAAARIFEVMSISFLDISAQNARMYEGENTEKDIERHVDEWIAENPDTWKGWLEQARKAAK
jgi:glycine betaine/proline transport system substrate-binding protein